MQNNSPTEEHGTRPWGEATLVLIKPDAFSRQLTGLILALYEEAGLEIRALKLVRPSLQLLENHYAEHAGKSFLKALLGFMQEGPVVAAVLAGADAVEHVRRINGATDPVKADPGTLRDLYGTDKQRNCVHGSATNEDARREISLWFPESGE